MKNEFNLWAAMFCVFSLGATLSNTLYAVFNGTFAIVNMAIFLRANR